MTNTISSTLAEALQRAPARPLLTWYDDATGDRTELSAATLDNWVAKTANLLVDGAGLGPGDTAAVLLPPHWQSAAVLLGCWSAGLAVDHGPQPRPVDILFVAAAGAADAVGWSAGDRHALSLLPMAAPARVVPPGHVDYVVHVRGYGDRFTPDSPIGADDPAVSGRVTLTHRDVRRRAAERAKELGIGADDRVLLDAARHADPLDWLLAPLAAGASVVLCASLDPSVLPHRVANERVTVILA